MCDKMSYYMPQTGCAARAACCYALTYLMFTRQVRKYLEEGAKDKLSWARPAVANRINRYERYVLEVRDWQELPGSAIKLASPV